MRYLKLILLIISIIAVIVLFGLGIGFLVAFIKDKFDDNILLAALIILVGSSLIYLVRFEIKSKKALTRNKSQYLELGKLLFKNYTNDFEVFYNSYLQGENEVISKSLRPIETLQKFTEKKGLSLIIDWKGEENEGEIEEFINSRIEKTISWKNTTKLREYNTCDVTRDSKFIIRLFKTIDKDLEEIKKKLLFFELGTDTFIFTVTDTTTFRKIIKIESKDFYGTEKLRI